MQGAVISDEEIQKLVSMGFDKVNILLTVFSITVVLAKLSSSWLYIIFFFFHILQFYFVFV